MSNLKVTMVALFLGLSLAACGTLAPLKTQSIVDSEIKSLRQINSMVFASGQPTKAQLELLSNAGVTNIIDLRPSAETDWDEASFVRSLGMRHHSIPISGGIDLTNSNAQLLQHKLAELAGQGVLVHCSSGNRVASLISIDQYMSKGSTLEAAIKEGKRWGLTKNEAAVRLILKDMERLN